MILMIKELKIKNFQSHVDTTVKFHPGLNVIVGVTNAGKSAILRALKKVIRDQPAGNFFINTDADATEISLTDNTNHIITRRVEAKKGTTTSNEYILASPGRDKVQHFGGFGRDIPIEISDALNAPIVTLGDDLKIDLHFSGQHDTPFLLGDKASVRSKVLGNVSGLSVIDSGVQRTKKALRKYKSDIDNTNDTIEKLKVEISTFPDIDNLKAFLQSYETSYSEITLRIAQFTELYALYNNLLAIKLEGKTLKEEIDAYPDVSQVNFKGIREKIGKYDDLLTLQNTFIQVNQNIGEIESHKLFRVNIEKLRLPELAQKIKTLTELDTLYTQFEEADQVINLLVKDLDSYDGKLKEAKNNWSTLLDELGVCPTCKQPTKGLTI